ncbi:hypothetical protein MLD38_027237 [Melastoma candidum]|uniref:Uncharacterized protein n=1 Tax=Melastoma candidum TaxID=119954 RepID=A0ACB9P753_9MYRT|nr:hypothetical protein MLD38_027237 [Melastoma candidum]
MSQDGKERFMLSQGGGRGGDCPPGLELGLGIGCVCSSKRAERARILTAQDLSSACSDVSPTSASQVVGWPPIRAYRMNSLVNMSKAPRVDDEKSAVAETKVSRDGWEDKPCEGAEGNAAGEDGGWVRFVKVYMDGVPIGRKVDLNAHSRYETLARVLADMFLQNPDSDKHLRGVGAKGHSTSLLDDLSDFVLTYEDKEGDWMLVGDVPWEMFLAAVRRLKIMRTSETRGLDSRFQGRNEKGRRKPV